MVILIGTSFAQQVHHSSKSTTLYIKVAVVAGEDPLQLGNGDVQLVAVEGISTLRLSSHAGMVIEQVPSALKLK